MPKKHRVDLHEQAFQLFLQNQSFEKIADEIGVAKSTVQRWSKGNPGRGEKPWSARAAAIRRKARASTDKRAADVIGKLYAQTVSLRDDVLSELENTHWKSKEGAIAAVRSLTDLVLKMMPERRELKDEALQAVFQVLFSDPDIGPVLEEHKDRILGRIDKALNKV